MTDTSLQSDLAHPDLAQRESGLGAALALTTASQVAATSSVLALTTIPTLVANTLGIGPHMIGYQVSLIYASGVIFSMMAGALAKRWGPARVGQLALLGAFAGFAGMATGHLWTIALASVLIGVGYALNNPSSSHVLSRLAPPARRNLIFSVKQAGVPLGGALAALAIPPLAQSFGWQPVLLGFSLIPLVLALVYQLKRGAWDNERAPDIAIGRGIWQGQRTVLSNPDLRALAFLGFFYSAVQLSISTFTVAMLIEEFGWSPVSAAGIAAIVQIAGAGGRIFWGLVADRLRNGFAVLAIVGFITGAAILGFSLIGNLPALGLALIGLAGFTGNGWNGVLLAETAHSSPGKGTLTGEVLTYTFIGVMVGPATFSLAFNLIGSFSGTFRLLAIVAFAGSLWALVRACKARR
ncbi:MFS transporter (plasmid) [Thioclava sp. 'Guangxiensis']|uniref:MFS transporter n=1 Tax=Thioclava sp. 'Guangxiensis' TaxID=3149044 RepID=UPI0032C457C7